MGARSLAYHVTVVDEQGEQHTFGPDSKVPAWAKRAITNPSAWAEDEAADQVDDSSQLTGDEGDVDDSGDAGQDDGGSTDGNAGSDEDGGDDEKFVPYAKRLKANLQAEVESRNEDRDDDDLIVVGGTGKVADLAAALEADDAAQDA